MEKSASSSSRTNEYFEAEDGGAALDLRELAGYVWDGRRQVAALAFLFLMLGVLFAVGVAPVYRADSAVQVESKSPMGAMSALKDVSMLLGGGGTPTDTEMEVIRSRNVVGDVVNSLGLDVLVEPDRIPLVGNLISRLRGNDQLAEPVLGLTGWAWGGEKLQVRQLNVPRNLEGEKLTLQVEEGGRYRLLAPDGRALLSGGVGKLAESSGVAILVGELVAHPGLAFTVVKQSNQDTIKKLQEKLEVKERGKKTGVLEVALEGEDPEKTAAMVNAVVKTYYDLNVERRTADAERTMSFLRDELPRLRADAQAAEQALSRYGTKRGAIDASFEAMAAGQASAEIEKQLAMARLQRTELQTHFTAQSPAMVALEERMQQLEREKSKVEQRLKGLPEPQIEGYRLQRDAKVANEIYLQVFGKVQELSVAKAIAIGNVRILDQAFVPEKPVRPKKVAVVVGAAVLGLILGIAAVIARGVFYRRVETAGNVERLLGVQVLGAIPQALRVDPPALGRASADGSGLLALSAPQDPSMEAVRGLATSLQFALLDQAQRIIALTGPGAGVGKSFVAANLAVTLAEAGKSVVLIDGDMRHGKLHEYFGARSEAGLSGLLSGESTMGEVLKPTPLGNLKLIPAGKIPQNPASLLMSDRFRKLTEMLAKQVDYLIIDAPPVVGVTDPLIIGRLATATCLVLRAGEHRTQDVEECYKQLVQQGVRVQGVVLNGTSQVAREYGRAALPSRESDSAGTYGTGGDNRSGSMLKRLFERRS